MDDPGIVGHPSLPAETQEEVVGRGSPWIQNLERHEWIQALVPVQVHETLGFLSIAEETQ